jgi:hypothetical protein
LTSYVFICFQNSKTGQWQLPMINSIDSLSLKFTPLTFFSFYLFFYIYIHLLTIGFAGVNDSHSHCHFLIELLPETAKVFPFILDCFFFFPKRDFFYYVNIKSGELYCAKEIVKTLYKSQLKSKIN